MTMKVVIPSVAVTISHNDNCSFFLGVPHFVLLCCCLYYTLYTVGRLVTGLVREFLEYFELDFTIAVFDPETNFVSHAL